MPTISVRPPDVLLGGDDADELGEAVEVEAEDDVGLDDPVVIEALEALEVLDPVALAELAGDDFVAASFEPPLQPLSTSTAAAVAVAPSMRRFTCPP